MFSAATGPLKLFEPGGVMSAGHPRFAKTPIPHQIMVPAAGTAGLAPHRTHRNASMRTAMGRWRENVILERRGSISALFTLALLVFGVPMGSGSCLERSKGKKVCEIGDVMQREGRFSGARPLKRQNTGPNREPADSPTKAPFSRTGRLKLGY
jgi:hypothetical protein